jgi:RNA polymerase sigma-70 factor (ECF subfamily)
MLSICLRYVKNRDIAEDVMQDGFVTVFTKLSQYRGTGSFEGWVKRIMINMSLSYLRQSSKIPIQNNVETLFGLSSDEDSETNQSNASDENFSETEMHNFSQQEIFDAISSLPEGFRTVFNLYALDGFKHREIANILGISVGTSKSQFLRARIKLQKALKKKT